MPEGMVTIFEHEKENHRVAGQPKLEGLYWTAYF
jgi:hypothetical protein